MIEELCGMGRQMSEDPSGTVEAAMSEDPSGTVEAAMIEDGSGRKGGCG